MKGDNLRKLNKYKKEDIKEVKNILSNQILNDFSLMPLTVGQRVLAVHPKTFELKTGSILTSDYNKFDVRFDNPDLGIGLIKDYNIIPISESI